MDNLTISNIRLSHYFFLFCTCLILSACYQEELEDGRILEEGRCQFTANAGIAEINGINRWLSIGEVQLGYGSTEEFYMFRVGGHRPDCSLYEEINLTLAIDRNSTVDGTYEIVTGYGMPGAATGEFITKIGNESRVIKELRDGTITIREIEFFRYEIDVEANLIYPNPITLHFTNPPR